MEKKGRVENLIPCSQRSKEEARELGKRGGKKSGEVRRERKRIQEEFIAKLKAKREGSEITIREEIVDKVISDLIENGDIERLEKMMKVLGQGEKEDESKGSTTTIVINEVVARNGGQ